jgi:two-component system, OmpR family, KDP operon response regulator KdpE
LRFFDVEESNDNAVKVRHRSLRRASFMVIRESHARRIDTHNRFNHGKRASASLFYYLRSHEHRNQDSADMTFSNNDARRNILFVNDEPQITRVLRTALACHGYNVRTASDGNEALEVMREWTPDLVITDLSMPNMGGPELCRRIRSQSAVFIIVLSVRDEEELKVESLDSGADDYVTKPFNMNEFMARVRAGIRNASPENEERYASGIKSGDFEIDLLTRGVTVRGSELRLTPKEFDLLCYLAKNPDRVLTHGMLLRTVWGASFTGQSEYLHVFMNRLRKKIEPEKGSARYIVTERWVGYRFAPGAPQSQA